MQWFRLWHEIIFDPKIRKLSVDQRWFWIACLCLASMSRHRGVIEGYAPEDIKEAAGFPFEDDFDAANTVETFIKIKMLRKNRLGMVITNWKTWQYDKPSDRPEAVKDRVQRYRVKRLRNAHETPAVTPRNALKRPRLDTDTDTERVDKRREEKIRTETDGKRETERETQARSSNPFLFSQRERELKEIQAKLKKLGRDH